MTIHAKPIEIVRYQVEESERDAEAREAQNECARQIEQVAEFFAKERI